MTAAEEERELENESNELVKSSPFFSRFWTWLLSFFLFSLYACAPCYAATEICGDGIDNDGTGGDLACPWDPDDDGYTSNDCDNSDRMIGPGKLTTSGCGAGQVRLCQSDGTFAACKNISSLTTTDAPTGTLAVYFISSSVGANTCTGSGTYASPWGYNCFSNTGATGYHAATAGDAYFVLNDGTYSATTWSGHQIYLNNKDGNSSHPISIIGIGDPVIPGAGSSPSTEVQPVDILDSDYVNVFGLEVDGTSGFGSAGIFAFGSSHFRAEWNHVHHINGICGDTNVSGIKAAGGSNYFIANNNKVHDNYTVGATSCPGSTPGNRNENNYQIVTMDCGPVTITHNVVYNSLAEGAGHLIAIKHGCAGGGCAVESADIGNNIFLGGSYYSELVFATKNARAHNNIIDAINKGQNGVPIEVRNLGGAAQFDGMEIDHNTILHGPFMRTDLDNTFAPYGTTIANFHDNVVIDDRSSAYATDESDGFYDYYNYGPDTDYTAAISKVTVNDNCYYNSAGTALRVSIFGNDFGATGDELGAVYTSFAALQAGGWDTSSYNEDPLLDSYNRATSSHCSMKGYQSPSAPGPAPTHGCYVPWY